MQQKNEAILFSSCTGLNDSEEASDAKYTPDGVTDVIGCINVTTTAKGKLVKVPALVPVLTHTSNIDELSAGSRMFVQSGTGIGLCDGSVITPLSVPPVVVPGAKAVFIHTPVDTRIRVNSTDRYKVPSAGTAAAVLAVGVNPVPVTSAVLEKMPDFTGGFVLGAKLYTAKDKFLQYSEDYSYDLFNIGNNFIGNKNAVLQCGQVPGCIATLHADGVTAYLGTGPHDFEKKFFPCAVIPGTLYSGFISKVYESAHTFLCSDGLYVLRADGSFVNLTVANTQYLGNLNSVYNTVTVIGGKYLAFGNSLCVEYDFTVKALLLRGTAGVTASCQFEEKTYTAAGNVLSTYSTAQSTEKLTCKVTLPYSNFGTPEYKQIRFLYFTGKVTGSAKVTVRNRFGDSAVTDVSNIGLTQKRKITGLRTCKGPELSVEIEVRSGLFSLEELTCAFMTCSNFR